MDLGLIYPEGWIAAKKMEAKSINSLANKLNQQK